MMRQVILCLALLFFLGLTLESQNGFASSEEGKTISLAKQTIHNDDLVEAKKGAVFQAMRAAVQEAVVKMVSISVITENLDLIYEKVLSDPEKYIANYKVLGDIDKQGQYLVALEATVDTSALKEFFAGANILNSAKETRPSILFLVSEQSFNEDLPRYWWGEDPLSYKSFADGALVALLEKKGYAIVGKGSTRPDPAALGITFDFIHDSTAAIKLGTALKADIVIIGRAMAKEPFKRLGGDFSCKATIALELFSTGSGERITSIDKEAVVPEKNGDEGVRKALIMAGELAGEAVVSKLQAKAALSKLQAKAALPEVQEEAALPEVQAKAALPEVQEEAASPEVQAKAALPEVQAKAALPKIEDQGSALDETVRPIETRFEGVNYLSNFIMLRKSLKTTPGIEGIQTREMGTEKAVVEILFKGNAKKLADLLMLKAFENFSIETADVAEDSMVIRFVTKKTVDPVAEPGVKSESEIE